MSCKLTLCLDVCDLVDCTELTAALDHVSSTLEEFELCVRTYFTVSQEHHELPTIKGQLGPLCELSCLRYLEAPIAVLLGWSPEQGRPLAEILPASLVCLHVTEDLCYCRLYAWTEELVLDKLETFFARVHKTLPLLEKFELTPWSFKRWDFGLGEQLHAMCWNADIACEINYSTAAARGAALIMK
jgi:hypothetical protein